MNWHFILIVIGIIVILAYFIKQFFNKKIVNELECELVNARKEHNEKLVNIGIRYEKSIKEIENKYRKQLMDIEDWYQKNESLINEENKKEFKKCINDHNYTGNKLDQYLNSFNTTKE